MTPTWYRRPLTVGDHGNDVLIVQRLLGLPLTGWYGDATAIIVRGLQRQLGLPLHGVVDEATAAALGEQEGYGLLPEWWSGDIGPNDQGWDYALELIGAEDADALRRFQGNHRLPPSGVVDEETARLIAGMEVESWGITLPRPRS